MISPSALSLPSLSRSLPLQLPGPSPSPPLRLPASRGNQSVYPGRGLSARRPSAPLNDGMPVAVQAAPASPSPGMIQTFTFTSDAATKGSVQIRVHRRVYQAITSTPGFRVQVRACHAGSRDRVTSSEPRPSIS
jgi:hypothetical protein